MNGIYDSSASAYVVGIEQITFDSDLAIDFTNGYVVNDTDDAHTIYGGHLADVIQANGGNDYIYAEGGNDTLIGGAGRDYLMGGAGDDTYVFASGFGEASTLGADDITENYNEGTDRILLTGGITQSDVRWWTESSGVLRVQLTADADDQIKVNGIYDSSASAYVVGVEQITFDGDLAIDFTNGYVLNDTDDAHTIYGGHLADVIQGNGGNDYIYAEGGNDILIGGAGRDYLIGGAGDDTYVFASGFGEAGSYGADDITENYNEGTDRILLTGGITQSDIRWWTESSGVLRVQLTADADDQIKVNGIYDSSASAYVVGIEQIAFDNDVDIDFTNGYMLNDTDDAHTIYGGHLADVIQANGGNDYIYAGSGNDTLIGGTGRDYLIGGAGDDTYVFANGFGDAGSYGADDITENYNEGTDRILLTGGITQSDVRWWTESSGVLRIQLTADADDQIKVNGIYDSSASAYVVGIEQITFDSDLAIDFTNGYVLNDTDDAHTIYGGHLADLIQANGGNDYIYAAEGNDLLDGGAGSDYLYGEAGDDTYRFSEGLDYIGETAGDDTLWITGGYTIDDVTVSDHSSYDTKVVINSYTDEITLSSFRSNTSYEVETIKFDDGFEADLPSYNSWMIGTTGSTMMSSSATGHVMLGLAGDDTMQGFGGDDTMHGGAGNDTLEGGDDDDFMHGGIGDDLLYGEDGLDVLFGGEGADTFFLEDTTAFNDIDVIKDFSTTDGDVLDISDILDNTSYVHGTDDIEDWLEITDSGANSVVKIDTTGTGTFGGGTQVATLESITGLTDEQALVSSGTLIAA